ncbi:Ig-like domain-containing protein, partial [Lysinibacillus fusiformis]|uniref:Ig-like domain-containing protein n=1 Tax=Lysinibacillus fusiformis TaxID=28031 RepID=UPI00046978DC
NVASVDSQGKVTAIGEGNAIITATTVNGLKTATAVIQVMIPVVPVTGITLNETSGNLKVGETKTITETVVPANATNKNVIWNSSDDTIAKVDNRGEVTAVAPGLATITVTTVAGQLTETYIATVNPTVTISGTTSVGQMLKADTTAPTGATITYQWQRSKADGTFEDIAGATSSTYTLIPADATQFIRVIVTANDSGYSATATSDPTIAITLTAAAIEGVGTTTTVLQLGETTTRTATTIEAGTKTWLSSDATVATINETTGVINALAAGSTTISYISTNGGKNSVHLTVYPEAAVVNPAYTGISTTSGPILPTLTGSNNSATVRTFSIGHFFGITGSFNHNDGSLNITSINPNLINSIEIFYVGNDNNGVVIEKGSVTVIINS